MLFTNKAIASNIAQVNDPLIQEWMEEAFVELDPSSRELLYYKIQKRLIENISHGISVMCVRISSLTIIKSRASNRIRWGFCGFIMYQPYINPVTAIWWC